MPVLENGSVPNTFVKLSSNHANLSRATAMADDIVALKANIQKMNPEININEERGMANRFVIRK